MPAPKVVLRLIDQFDRNLDAYRSGHYNETQVRLEFIDPFFKALGWDIYNEQGIAEAYKDVVHEAAVKVGGSTKAPDYSFRIGGTRKFFLEAKKPSVYIKDDPHPAFQLRRYAWSAKLPLSILTDFEEFAVYDCRVKPVKTDKPSNARVLYFTYTEYADRWDELYGLFSKDAVLKGDFDRYVASTTRKRGTAEVDNAFLQEIETWRDALARNISLRNGDLTQREVNFAVNRTIDRIIFLRICEDRGTEEPNRLMALQNGTNVYKRLTDFYYRADEKYNSGLFHFHKERDRPLPPDELTLKLAIDDKVLKDIFKGLYYPESPYEFSVLPADILGQVYEQFLGKVIRLTAGHHAKVEDKPEVKKAGGVYYTPTYIVDYIVKHTVGKLLESKTPRQAAKLRILDPACGSGSFLLGAYQLLLDWHRDWYVEDGPDKHKKQIYQAGEKEWRLTTAERKRILLKNIYGVDIDPQAVEVTKLSLLLKVLEGESGGTINRQLKLLHERALPDLGSNIKCGNSLIAPDFYHGQQISLLDEEERYRINVFDWEAEFPEIFNRQDAKGAKGQGGFDAVIGNPPYLNVDDTWGKGDLRQRYLKRFYSSVYNDKTDIFYYFLAKAITLTKSEVGFIVSRTFLEAYKADKLRSWIADNISIREIIDFQNHYVFKDVGITTSIIILSKKINSQLTKAYQLVADDLIFTDLHKLKNDKDVFISTESPQKAFSAAPWVFVRANEKRINKKIDSAGTPLGKTLIVGQGMQTGRNNVFGKLDESIIDSWGIKPEQYFFRARNSDIFRFYVRNSKEVILYLEDTANFTDLTHEVQEHLKAHANELKARAAYKRGDCEWWKFTWPLHKEYFSRNKIYCPYLATHNRFAIDEQQQFLGLTDTTVLFDGGQQEELRYILGLLNSRLLTFRFKYIGKLKSGGILEYFWNSVSKIPIRRIDFSNSTDKARHDHMVEFVDQMLALQKQLAAARTEHDKTALQRQIDATDRQIDELVYEFYGLTEEEVAIVEGG